MAEKSPLQVDVDEPLSLNTNIPVPGPKSDGTFLCSDFLPSYVPYTGINVL